MNLSPPIRSLNLRGYRNAQPAFQWAPPSGLSKAQRSRPRSYLHVSKDVKFVPMTEEKDGKTEIIGIQIQVQTKGTTYRRDELEKLYEAQLKKYSRLERLRIRGSLHYANKVFHFPYSHGEIENLACEALYGCEVER